MKQPRPINATAIGLYAVAALLLANLLVSLGRRPEPMLPAAYGQVRQPPIAGGAGFYVMPAQLENNAWGAYLMDVDRGTMCVYRYMPGSRELQFVASRNFRNDVQLSNYNTTPPPQEIGELVRKQNEGVRIGNTVIPPPDEGPPRQ